MCALGSPQPSCGAWGRPPGSADCPRLGRALTWVGWALQPTEPRPGGGHGNAKSPDYRRPGANLSPGSCGRESSASLLSFLYKLDLAPGFGHALRNGPAERCCLCCGASPGVPALRRTRVRLAQVCLCPRNPDRRAAALGKRRAEHPRSPGLRDLRVGWHEAAPGLLTVSWRGTVRCGGQNADFLPRGSKSGKAFQISSF